MTKGQKNHTLHCRLKKQMSDIGKCLNESLHQVLEAMEKKEPGRALRLIPKLQNLQGREDASREDCLKILALTKGNTDQLRWTRIAHKILSIMKESSAEIEEIAHKVAKIKQNEDLPHVKDLPIMGQHVSRMLKKSIHAVLEPDAEHARSVIKADSSLDRSKQVFTEKAFAFLIKHPEATQFMVPYLFISKHLERIGDQASHMAEEVVYYLHDPIC